MKVFSEANFRKHNPHVAQSAIAHLIGKTPAEITDMGYGYSDDWFTEHRQSQKQRVIEMLKRGDVVSNKTCSAIGILRISQVIKYAEKELEKEGLFVNHVIVEHPTNKQCNWTEYRLEK